MHFFNNIQQTESLPPRSSSSTGDTGPQSTHLSDGTLRRRIKKGKERESNGERKCYFSSVDRPFDKVTFEQKSEESAEKGYFLIEGDSILGSEKSQRQRVPGINMHDISTYRGQAVKPG